ncbi:MAG: DUF1579 domain-containing protein [Vicinamibacteria bacterium]|nr:DUF1579 domain-containing protein [Vicinamibacteria bacterium]
MTRTRLLLPTVGIALGLVSSAYAQGMPPMPTPGPEHAVLKMDEGTWDAVIELAGPPGAPAMTSKGVEVDTIGCGGLCLITDFKGEMMPGMTFHGHGTTTYDTVTKKYVGSWTDSMSAGLAISQGTYDPATKKASSTMEGRDMTGAMVKSRGVAEYPDADHRVMTMFAPAPDGKEMQVMRITYTRRK